MNCKREQRARIRDTPERGRAQPGRSLSIVRRNQERGSAAAGTPCWSFHGARGLLLIQPRVVQQHTSLLHSLEVP